MEPTFIGGEVNKDERGMLTSFNRFDLSNYCRFYKIKHSTTRTIRAWQGHQFETKAFYLVRGSFFIAVVKINNWNNPSEVLRPKIFHLDETKSGVLIVPPGYANGFKAKKSESELIVFSDKTLNESIEDDYRFDQNNWIDWNKL
jgi:dTDP-4-dehydrorhamnose 3,5-epimerase